MGFFEKLFSNYVRAVESKANSSGFRALSEIRGIGREAHTGSVPTSAARQRLIDSLPAGFGFFDFESRSVDVRGCLEKIASSIDESFVDEDLAELDRLAKALGPEEEASMILTLQSKQSSSRFGVLMISEDGDVLRLGIAAEPDWIKKIELLF